MALHCHHSIPWDDIKQYTPEVYNRIYPMQTMDANMTVRHISRCFSRLMRPGYTQDFSVIHKCDLPSANLNALYQWERPASQRDFEGTDHFLKAISWLTQRFRTLGLHDRAIEQLVFDENLLCCELHTWERAVALHNDVVHCLIVLRLTVYYRNLRQEHTEQLAPDRKHRRVEE